MWRCCKELKGSKDVGLPESETYSALKNMAELAVCLSGASLRIVCVNLLSPLDLFPSLCTEWRRVVRKQF